MGPIVLIGFMGSGKSAVARALAKNLNLKVIDLDEEIENKEKISISEIFKRHGENFFRNKESETIDTLPTGRYVLSLGGGTLMVSENISKLDRLRPTYFFLKADKATLKERISRNTVKRPLLNDVEDIDEFIDNMLHIREPVYSSIADHIIITCNLSINEVAAKIIRLLNSC